MSQAASLALHAIGALLVMLFLNSAAVNPDSAPPPKSPKNLVYVVTPPGPSGGGGGSQAPAAPAALQIPKPRPIEVVPTVSAAPAEQPPTLSAPVMTSATALLTASGIDGTVALPSGGGGKGSGIGGGDGTGLGPGSGPGFDGTGFAGTGGIEAPRRLREVRPQYTAEAMRLKIQGSVVMDALVDASGRVIDVRVTKSLDRTYGLDEQARRAALETRFAPCTKAGVAVACRVIFDLQFTLR